MSAALYEEDLPIALREVARYLIYAIVSVRFEFEGVLEDVARDFREIRTDGIINRINSFRLYSKFRRGRRKSR